MPVRILFSATVTCCGCALQTAGSLDDGAGDAADLTVGDARELYEDRRGEIDQPLIHVDAEDPSTREDGGAQDAVVEEDGEACECTPGGTGECVHACGAAGTRTCLESCAWGPCVITPEGSSHCNGHDDDCDYSVDEGCHPSLIFPDPPVAAGPGIVVTATHNIGAICVYLSVDGPCGHKDISDMEVVDPNPPPCAWQWTVPVPAPGDYDVVFMHQPPDSGCPYPAGDCLCNKAPVIAGRLHVTGSGSCP